MTMRSFGLALLAAGLVALAGSGTVRADNDTIRLGTAASGAAGGASVDVDTTLVYWRGGHWGYGGGWGHRGYGGGWAGYRPFWGGYHRAFYRPFWGGGYGYRPFYRPYVYGGYYQYGGYSQPCYGSGYYSGGYSQPYYGSSYYSGGYYPCVGQTVSPAVVVAQLPLPVQYATPTSLPYVQYGAPTSPPYQVLSAPQLLPRPAGVPVQPGPDATFQYDGGPAAPLPLPGAEQVDPASGPRPAVPLQGKLVHVQKQTTGGSTQFTTHYVSLGGTPPAAATAPRTYTYPAYGETPLPPVRKQSK